MWEVSLFCFLFVGYFCYLTGSRLNTSYFSLNNLILIIEASEYGANINDCIRQHPQSSEAEIRQAIDALQSEGMIYSTVNEDNFKCAS